MLKDFDPPNGFSEGHEKVMISKKNVAKSYSIL